LAGSYVVVGLTLTVITGSQTYGKTSGSETKYVRVFRSIIGDILLKGFEKTMVTYPVILRTLMVGMGFGNIYYSTLTVSRTSLAILSASVSVLGSYTGSSADYSGTIITMSSAITGLGASLGFGGAGGGGGTHVSKPGKTVTMNSE
jgi:hypothetical protein